VLSASIQVIDGTIVNVAIPTMMGNLGVELNAITWVSSSYLIAHVVILPIIGWLSHMTGRKNYLLSCIVLFVLASVGCGLSPNLGVLIFFRIVQGFAGGALMPISLSLLFEAFGTEHKAKATAIFGACVMVAPALGPLLGGYLTQYFGWRYIFFVNIPIGMFAVALGLFGLQNEERGAVEKIDYLGLLFLVLGVGFFQFAIERGEVLGWLESNWIAFSFFCALIFIPLFVIRCLFSKTPLIDLSLLGHLRVNVGCLMMLILGYTLYGIGFLIPIYADKAWSLDTIQTGWIFVPGALIASCLMPLISFSTKYFRATSIVSFGLLLTAIGAYYFAMLNNLSSHFHAYLPSIISRVGFAFSSIPAMLVAMQGYQGRQSTEVSSLLNFSRQFGGSVSFAIVATLLSNFQKKYYALLKGKVTLLSSSVQQFEQTLSGAYNYGMQSEIGEGTQSQMVAKLLQSKVELQAFVLSFDRIMWITMFVTLLFIIPLLFIPKKAK
jgi:DHA2 family multidrug resistance protein